MIDKILLIFGSREGHTHRMMQKLQNQLKSSFSNAEFDLVSANDLETVQPNLDNYKAVVIGASIHYGYYPKTVINFVEQHAHQLNNMPSFFFGVNLVARKPNKDTVETNVYTYKFLKKSSWSPTEARCFAGALNYSQLNFFDRHIIRMIMFLTKGETHPSTNLVYTDWNKFSDFGNSIINKINNFELAQQTKVIYNKDNVKVGQAQIV